MEQLFNDMRQHLTTQLGSRLAQITEDCGQLDAVENGTAEQYPLSFPCVLISMPEVEWSALKTDEPRGRATLTVKVAFECAAEATGNAQTVATQGGMAGKDGGSDSEGIARTQGEPGKTAAEDGRSDSEGTAITERLKLAAEVNASLNGWIFEGCGRPLRRTHSHQYSRRGEIKVYEVTYATVVQE